MRALDCFVVVFSVAGIGMKAVDGMHAILELQANFWFNLLSK
jgi:hypothetical protein